MLMRIASDNVEQFHSKLTVDSKGPLQHLSDMPALLVVNDDCGDVDSGISQKKGCRHGQDFAPSKHTTDNFY